MNIICLDNIPFALDLDDLASKLNIKKNDDDFNSLEDLVKQASEIGRPKALFRVSSVEGSGETEVLVDEISFSSKLMRANTEKLSRVFPFVVTSGTELENWSSSISDLLEGYWARFKKLLAWNLPIVI